nr:CDF family Co(II)/Ni(II) efflux transporter DmeF [Myxosarcina sp. GI1]
MHEDILEQWQHSHNFSITRDRAEQNTTIVMWLTAITMVVEIIAGSFFGSMALLADGWHMATHVAAFGIAVFAYRYARHHANNPRYTFGTGKVTVLGGYTSAVALAVTALTIAIESITRFFEPIAIRFNEAIAVAILGLIVNLVSAWLLQDSHHHDHHHDHHHHHDSNLQAAYIHVLTDALTSILAIIALFAGKFLVGFGWMQ